MVCPLRASDLSSLELTALAAISAAPTALPAISAEPTALEAIKSAVINR